MAVPVGVLLLLGVFVFVRVVDIVADKLVVMLALTLVLAVPLPDRVPVTLQEGVPVSVRVSEAANKRGEGGRQGSE